jgi:hypothetical protein
MVEDPTVVDPMEVEGQPMAVDQMEVDPMATEVEDPLMEADPLVTV